MVCYVTWYDIKQIDVDRHVDTDQLRQSADWVHDLMTVKLSAACPVRELWLQGFRAGR